MSLNKYQRFCYRRFGRICERKASDKLKRDLESSHMNIRGGAYLSYIMLLSILSLVFSLSVLSILVFMLFPLVGVFLEQKVTLSLFLLPFLVSIMTYWVSLRLPAFRAKARAKNIDANLAYAVNFISAMSSAGVTPTEIFKSLSKQEIYGEIKEEAAWIYRDVALLGSDIVTAIKHNIRRTPSQRFKEFLQGLVVTVTSGGSLKSYFSVKAKQFMWENRQAQKQMQETLGIMAESYVTTAVAGVLLVLIIIPLMMVISGNAGQFGLLYLFIFIVIPLIHLGFAFVVKLTSAGV